MTNNPGLIIRKLVGNFVEMQDSSIEMYPHLPLSIFVPSLGNCEHSISSEHSHPAFSFILLIDALDEIIIQGFRKKSAGSFDLALCAISPGIKHQEIEREGPNKYIAIFIEPEFYIQALEAHGLEVGSYCGDFVSASSELLHLANLFVDIYIKNSVVKDTLLDNISSLIAHEIISLLHSNNKQAIGAGIRIDKRLEKVIHYLQNNYHSDIKIDELAKMASLSIAQFSKVFKEQSGLSPKKYLLELRLQQARMRLRRESREAISEISYACGFSQPGYFSAQFKKRFGVSPGSYKENFSK